MGFDFTGIKTNLEGINKYLESNGIKLSDDESQQLVSIFNKVDTSVYKKGEHGYNDGQLDFLEENEFKKQIASILPKIADKTNDFFSGIRDKFLNGVTNEYTEAKTDAISNGNIRTQAEIIHKITNLNLTNQIKTENLIKNEIKAKGIKLSNADIKYWSNLVDKVAKKYNSSPELLITIISKECGFEKHKSNGNGAGPMGITTVAIEDFLPKTKNGKPNDWAKIYKNMHPELVNDIIKHSNSATVLRSKAGKNDELGIQLGLLTYEMKYCREVATKLYGKANYTTIPKAIEDIKNGYRLDKKSDEKYLKNAFRNYNASKYKEQYSRTTLDSLKRLTNNSFKDLIFIKKEK